MFDKDIHVYIHCSVFSYILSVVVAFTFRLILNNSCGNKDKISIRMNNFVLHDLFYHNNK